VVGVAGFVRLLTVRESEARPTLDDVSEAGELRAIVGQTLEQRREVTVRRVRLEADRVPAVEVLEPDVDPLEGDPLCCCLPGNVRHRPSSFAWTTATEARPGRAGAHRPNHAIRCRQRHGDSTQQGQSRPCSYADAVAAAREATCSFARMLLTWRATGRSLP